MIWGHDQLQEDLAAHLRGNSDRMVWTDMQMGPSGSPRPDVYTLPKSFSRFTPLSYEIKISVADFRRDVTAGKWQKYLEFSAGVIFAVPDGLIKKEDVPLGCGLIVRYKNAWKTVKSPTLRAVESLQRNAWMKLLIDGVHRQVNEPRPRMASEYMALEAIRKKYGDKIAGLLSDFSMAERNLQANIDKAKITTSELISAEQQRMTNVRVRVSGEIEQLTAIKKTLCTELGLGDNINYYDLRNHVKQIHERLTEVPEIARLRSCLKRAHDALADGLSVPLDKGDS